MHTPLAFETVCHSADRGSLTVDGLNGLNPSARLMQRNAWPLGHSLNFNISAPNFYVFTIAE